jgi:DNA polymerase III sliding clamp (beta) subunit (PCNA family)
MLDGQFPNWEMVVPRNQPWQVEVEADALGRSLQRAYVTVEERHGVVLRFTKDQVTVEVEVNDRGQSDDCVAATTNLNGDEVRIRLNPDYLQEFVSRSEGTLTCEFTDATKQILLTNGVHKYVVMPMHLD